MRATKKNITALRTAPARRAAIGSDRANGLDTIEMADKLNDIANSLALADIAVLGLAAASAVWDPASSGLRDLLMELRGRVSDLSEEIHPESVDAEEARAR